MKLSGGAPSATNAATKAIQVPEVWRKACLGCWAKRITHRARSWPERGGIAWMADVGDGCGQCDTLLIEQ
jgi:hypothetical protein